MVEIVSGDIADPWVVQKAMDGAVEVYLLSAMKHVGLAEVDVKTCIDTNIVGCMNIIKESLLTCPEILMFISSDKSAQPAGVYGCSKKIGEKLIDEAGRMNKFTKYRTVRYGNVFGSTGSFITKWIPKMQAGQEIIITDPKASRFFWTVKEAVDLIFECIDKAVDSTPFVPKMKAVEMGVVLEACMEVYGKCPVKVIGLQAGENKVETTDGIVYSDAVEQFTKEEFINKFLK
jgi:FlaA1/EpsC-like NDP-sugar epimerase